MASASILGDIAGKVAFVTGSSSGIGAATAVEFARHGLRVALHGRSEERLQQTAELCEQAGAKPQNILKTVGDLENSNDNAAVVEAVIAKFGTVDIFISNAGAVSLGGGLEGTDMEELDRMLQINLKAPFQFMKLLRPHLLKNKGSVVFISSDSARLPTTAMLAYTVAKGALTHMAKCLALEFAETGVRCNIISPCWVRTSVLKTCGYAKTEQESDQIIADNERFVVQKRIPYPDEIARTIVFVASGATPYLNGQDIVLDGGNILTSLVTHGWWLKSGEQDTDGGVLADMMKGTKLPPQ